VLQRIGSHQEIILPIGCTNNDAPACIFLSGDRSEANRGIDVIEFLILEERDGPWLRLGNLGEHLTAAGGAIGPFACHQVPIRILLGQVVRHLGVFSADVMAIRWTSGAAPTPHALSARSTSTANANTGFIGSPFSGRTLPRS